MRKRLQKKKSVGRYQEFCFPLSLTANPDGEFDWDRFFGDFFGMIESIGAQCGGGTGPGRRAQMVIVVGRREADPERRRRTIIDWLNDREEIASVRAGELVDARRPPKGWWNNWISGR